MIYCQLHNRAKAVMGTPLRLKDAARVLAPRGADDLTLPCPDQEGVWKLEAIAVAAALQERFPGEEVTLMGADVCYVHRIPPPRKHWLRPLRAAAAFLILLMGSALGLAWFHSDVDMPRAQYAVYEALTGQPPEDPRLITIPYCIGVALGVSVFYALPSRKATTPLEVKLTEYQEDMEKTEGKDIE